MRMHPEALRSVGIDGIFPPPLAGGVAAWTSAGEGINAVFDACSAQPACRDRYGDIGETFRELVRKYEENPETVTVDVEGIDEPVKVTISGGMLVQWTVSPGTHLASTVPAAIDALANGDPEPIAASWAAPRLNPAGVGILGNGLFYGVSCSEWVPFETKQEVIQTGRQAFPTFPRSVHANAPNLQFMRSNCDAWNVPPVRPSCELMGACMAMRPPTAAVRTTASPRSTYLASSQVAPEPTSTPSGGVRSPHGATISASTRA